MINIRNGVFETNSSSSHSICINNNRPEITVDLSKFIDEHGMWPLMEYDLTFYRHPFRVLTTPESKIKYAIACTAYLGTQSNEFKRIEETVHELEPNFEHFVFMRNSQWDCNKPNMGGTDDAILFPWLKEHNVDLKTFISDSRYFVVCDGDEYNIFEDLIRTGIISPNIQTDDC